MFTFTFKKTYGFGETAVPLLTNFSKIKCYAFRYFN